LIAAGFTSLGTTVHGFHFWAHMIQPIYVVKPFDLLAAATLIMITAVIGYYVRLRRRISFGTDCIDRPSSPASLSQYRHS
jgi:hypothetical protein